MWKRVQNFLPTLVVIVGIFAFRWSFADQYVIPSGSMEPTIQIGDHVIVNKLAYDFRAPFSDSALFRTGEPRRGDVIVFIDPRDGSTRLIKRLAGLPGERIEVDGRVWQVPPGEYFFLGDNRGNSADSRYWGTVKRSALLGRATRIFYSVTWPGVLPEVSFARSGLTL
ncbi:MAG: signal peptidase I [Bacteriovoracia bacterium]